VIRGRLSVGQLLVYAMSSAS